MYTKPAKLKIPMINEKYLKGVRYKVLFPYAYKSPIMRENCKAMKNILAKNKKYPAALDRRMLTQRNRWTKNVGFKADAHFPGAQCGQVVYKLQTNAANEGMVRSNWRQIVDMNSTTLSTLLSYLKTSAPIKNTVHPISNNNHIIETTPLPRWFSREAPISWSLITAMYPV